MIQSAVQRQEAADARVTEALHAENTGTETERMFVIRQRAARAQVLREQGENGKPIRLHIQV